MTTLTTINLKLKKKMKNKNIILLSLIVLMPCITAFSQGVAINTGGNPPVASAGLDVDFSNKGVVFPRIALTSAIDNTTVSSPVTGLFLYNTATAGSGTNAIAPGYHFWDGTRWQRLINNSYSYAGAITGIFSSSLQNLTTVNPANQYLGSYISLPPGNWIVHIILLERPNNGAQSWDYDDGFGNVNGDGITGNDGIWTRVTISESNSTFSTSPDIVGSNLASGSVQYPLDYGLVNGVIRLNNTSSGNKTYYLWGGIQRFNTESYLSNFSCNSWAEDQFFALPAQ
jgi:hypothetical protein